MMTWNKRRGCRGMAAGALALAAGLMVGAPMSGPALGQNALGDGRALDANLRQGSGGRNAAGRDFSSEIALRNAIVTGNAGGGKSFRGDVGYTATDDFRGSLGSNDLFEFNRESTYSGLAAQNIRGIGALQYQLGQATAGMTRGLGGDLIIRRAGTGIESGEVIGTPAPRATATIDPFGHMRSALRSTSDYTVRASSFPKLLTALEGDGSGPTYVTASPLQGVKALGISNSALGLTPGLEELGRRPGREGEIRGLTLPGQKRDEEEGKGEGDGESPELSRTLSQRLNTGTAHEQLLADMRARQSMFRPEAIGRRVGEPTEADAPGAAADEGRKPDAPGGAGSPEVEPGAPSADDSLSARLEQLRKEFATQPEMPWQREERERREVLNAERRKQDLERLKDQIDPNDLLAAADDLPAKDDQKQTEIQELIKKARETLGPNPTSLNSLIAEEGTTDLYTVHMRKGQDLLVEEKWFAAEERFAAALRARPGDAMAAAGRISAEIGAGMYRSAAINLRTMLSAYPEMLQTRLSTKLFPSGERLMRVRAQLRIRSELDTPVARDVGFLLAYVGSQTDNREDMRDGFAIMRRVDAAMNSEFDKLEDVARALWLNP